MAQIVIGFTDGHEIHGPFRDIREEDLEDHARRAREATDDTWIPIKMDAKAWDQYQAQRQAA